MELGGITIAVIIFVLFLLITGFIVGTILMALRKNKSQKVDDAPQRKSVDSPESERDAELEKREKSEKDTEDKI